ncbi:MFS transporter [Shewanella sp. 3B26]|uniref:MFS transporter n=1 Tax=Shewanella zhuhaiensis TaxID=2919576 RepID=A0AAJ1BKK3_9GAMM|nr:MFS transporter [Shewanella zhuhaiensis]
MNNRWIVLYALITFFVISLITNSMGPIFPALIDSYNIGLSLAGLFPFAFFIAYGVMSIPAGMLVEAQGEKRVMLLAFGLAFVGASGFYLYPSFTVAMVSLFCIGAGMSLLQVAINPLLRQAAGPEHFAFFSVAAQLAFGGAATLTPLIYQQLVTDNPDTMAWLGMYALFALVAVLMQCLTWFLSISRVVRVQDERVGSWHKHKALFADATVRKFFFAIVAYVALEQGVANAISVFLEHYHGLDSVAVGASVVSDFWLYMTLGCVLGLLLLKLVDSQKLLILFSLGATTAFLLAVWGGSQLAVLCFPLVGFFISILWSVIFSLALNSRAEDHGAFAGILCTGIIGGALISPLIGLVAEWFVSLRLGLMVLLLPLGYIAWVGLSATPLVRNRTLLGGQSAGEQA